MELRIASEVFGAFPWIRIAVLAAQGVDNETTRPAAQADWQASWSAAAAAPDAEPAVAEHPRIRPWRECFRALGVSPRDFPSSIEALVRRARRGGEPFRVNPLVDWYNSVSLRHVVPAGGFDLDDVTGPLELRFTRAGDVFAALDGSPSTAVPPGEVAYVDGAEVLTRHVVWRQSRRGAITPATTRVLLVSEVLGELPGGLPEVVLQDLRQGLAEIFGVDSTGGVADERRPVATW